MSQGINVEILPVAKYVYSTYVLQNWANNRKVDSDTHWDHYIRTCDKTPLTTRL